MPKKNETISAQGQEIAVVMDPNQADYISITDIAKYNSSAPNDLIKNWMRSLDTLDFLGLWETLNNSDFKPVEFDGFRAQAGRNRFTMSPTKWIEGTGAIGIRTKSGRYGGTYAHVDIAMEFASWVSPEFKLYIIKDYQRLKTEEQKRLSAEWNLQRTLAKINYRIHTDAIKEHIIPKQITKAQVGLTYASEADMLNVALFGMTAAQWRDENPHAKRGENIRDFATLEQLVVLSNLESINALLIAQGLPQTERIIQLNKTAITQMTSLVSSKQIQKLSNKNK